MKTNPHLPQAVTAGISLILAILAVIALYFFWHIENQSHRNQLQLVQIESAVNLANGLEWKMVSDKEVTPQEEQELYSSLQSIQSIFKEMDPRVRNSLEITHLHDLSVKYADALIREVFLMSTGHVDEAHEVDETEVDPTLDELHDGLVAANKAQGKRASAAARIQIIGSLGVVLISCSFILMLFHRTQRLRVSRLAAETSNRTKSEFLANMSRDSHSDQRRSWHDRVVNGNGVDR